MTTKNKDAFLDSIRGATPIVKKNTLKKKSPPNNTKYNEVKKLDDFKNKVPLNVEKKIISSNFEIQKTNINKKLKKGRIQIDKKIDFHGLSVFDAETLFIKTIKSCYNKNQRCVLFVTGKGMLNKNNDMGESSKLYYGKIRNSFDSWTRKEELQKYILSVEQANMEQGADGAFYIYLRKKKN